MEFFHSLRKHTRRIHNCDLTEEEIAEIYRQSVGHTNPHDFTVSLSNGRMLRRSDLELAAQHPHEYTSDLAAETAAATAAAEVAAVSNVQTTIDASNTLSPLLASNTHNNMDMKFGIGVEEEDETATVSVSQVSQVSQSSTSLSTHEESIHTYILPGMEEHGQLPHFKLENSGSF